MSPFLPGIIGAVHDKFINRFVLEGKPKIIRRYRLVIAKDKNGFIIPVLLYINYYW